MTVLYSALALGSIYALVAVGYNVVLLSSGALNFAQAQLMMLGAFVAYTGYVTWKLPAVAVIVVAAVLVLGISVILERVAIRPVNDHKTQLITTLGFGTMITGGAQIIWGTHPLRVPSFAGSAPVTLFGGRAQPADFALVVLAVSLVLAINMYTKRTLGGLALLATSQDAEAATLRGVNVRRLILLSFAAIGALAGLMGVFIGPKTFAVATLGLALALKGFVALAIGGFGSLYGGLVGGFTVGLVEQFTIRYQGSEYSGIAVFAVLILVLLLRPAGLFGQSTERRV